jgi:hypothetical protein
MAYIAPSLWTVNEYGAGLRKLLHRTRQLERWLDFKSFQVFKEAITYTALQFFTLSSNAEVGVAVSDDGEVGDIDWSSNEVGLSFSLLESDAEWLMLVGMQRNLLNRLADKFEKLGSKKVTDAIFQGIVTSLDDVYHLKRLGKASYLRDVEGDVEEFEIEDEVMKPLVSGPEAKRFVQPVENYHVLFPYLVNERGDRNLLSGAALKKRYPKAYNYLKRFETPLRQRETPKIDVDDGWWGYVYPKNLTSHDRPKLIVAQTVPSMRVSADFDGKFYLNNVRVNGILPAKGTDIAFLLGVLNGEVADFVFRRVAKPKQGGWFEANKQFIAPLPIPKATPKQQAEIGKRARQLQEMWTSRRDVIAEVEGRLSVLPRMRYKERFLWPDLPDLRNGDLPKNLKASEHAAYLKLEHEKQVAARLDALQGFLNLRTVISADFNKGELRLLSNGRPMLDKIYLDDDVGPLVAQYWRYVISQRKTEAKTLAQALGSYPTPNESDASRQFMQRVDALLQLNADLQNREREMNLALFDLYGLSTDERQLIERDCAKRPLL